MTQATPRGSDETPPASEGFGSPPATEGFGAAPQPESTAAPQRSRGRGILRRILIYVVGLAVLGGGGLAYKYFSGDPDSRAEVGSCLADLPAAPAEGQEARADDAKVVSCTATDAKYKVVGRFENKTKDEADTSCETVTETEYIFTSMPTGGRGLVLCLSTNTN